MYFSIGQVTEFQFARQLVPNILEEGKMGYLNTFGETWGFMPSANAVTFIDNHDTQRGEAQLTYKNEPLYNLANVFMLAHPYGHPKVMSSYAFNDHDQGPPSNSVHQGSDVNCGKGEWVCEHRWPQIAGMVAFRKTAGNSAVANFASDLNNDAIAFSRAGKGFVLINRSSNQWVKTLQTGLAAGTYTDVLADVEDATITVASDGMASFSVGSMHACAIHIGAKVF
jgi:alpha-amylase